MHVPAYHGCFAWWSEVRSHLAAYGASAPTDERSTISTLLEDGRCLLFAFDDYQDLDPWLAVRRYLARLAKDG
jgi:hypothetical protein